MATPCALCDPSCLVSAANSEISYRFEVLKLLCNLIRSGQSAVVGRIKGTYNGTNQSVIAAPGAGYKIVVRSLYVQTEDANTDVQFNSRTGVTNTAVGPNFDFLSNAGAVLPKNEDGWFECLENEALVVTTTGAVDLLGTYVVVPV